MERKIYWSIVIAATLTLVGCANTINSCQVQGTQYYEGRSCAQHFQADLTKVLSEPSLIATPFQYTGRTWFDTDKSVLRPQGKRELDALAASLQQAKAKNLINSNNKVVIIGHTDSRASRSYNQRLSERRATSVASYLSSKGIPSTSMLAIGKGEMQPVASNRTRSGMQKNRRVEIHIDGDAIHVVYD